MYKLGIDIGGTFTDFALVDQDIGETVLDKEPTTSDDPSEGALRGARRIIEENDISFEDIETVIHGTTLVSNTAIEKTGAKTGLLTTDGMRDVLEYRRGWRYDVFDWDIRYPSPLVPRERRLEVRERMDAQGNVDQELDLDNVRGQVRTLVEDYDVEAIAVCLLHSYENERHEQEVAAIIANEYPDIHVSLSSEVAPIIKEYERTSTTVMNAYVAPVVEKYVDTFEGRLREEGFESDVFLMTSTGGIVDVTTAKTEPVRIIESGPAAGVLVNGMFADIHDLDDVFSFDMGGTTAKGAAVVDGEVPTSYETNIAREYRFKEGSGYDLITPMIDLTEIGAGGGSIAAINDLGLVDVGPESAGAEPGPVCYDQGGTQPAVTDAAFLLGYLTADNFFGGRIELNEQKTREAFEEHLTSELDISQTEAAWQVFEVVNENMASAFRKYTSSRGIDPRSLDLVTIGGAGPMVAFELAKKLGIETIVCPYGSGVGSSIGLVKAPRLYEASVTHQAVLTTMRGSDFVETFEDLYDEARDALVAAGADEADLEIEPSLDMRHVQQGYEIEVPLSVSSFDEIDADLAKEQFRSVYQDKYDRDILEFPIEVMNFHLTLTEATDEAETLVGDRGANSEAAEPETREVYFDDHGHVPAAVHRWDGLQPGTEVMGPVIVEADQTTAVIDPDATLTVAENMDLIIEREDTS